MKGGWVKSDLLRCDPLQVGCREVCYWMIRGLCLVMYMLIWLCSSNVAYATMYLLKTNILIMLLLPSSYVCYAAKASNMN